MRQGTHFGRSWLDLGLFWLPKIVSAGCKDSNRSHKLYSSHHSLATSTVTQDPKKTELVDFVAPLGPQIELVNLEFISAGLDIKRIRSGRIEVYAALNAAPRSRIVVGNFSGALRLESFRQIFGIEVEYSWIVVTRQYGAIRCEGEARERSVYWLSKYTNRRGRGCKVCHNRSCAGGVLRNDRFRRIQ